jgi:hypothetical protein
VSTSERGGGGGMAEWLHEESGTSAKMADSPAVAEENKGKGCGLWGVIMGMLDCMGNTTGGISGRGMGGIAEELPDGDEQAAAEVTGLDI